MKEELCLPHLSPGNNWDGWRSERVCHQGIRRESGGVGVLGHRVARVVVRAHQTVHLEAWRDVELAVHGVDGAEAGLADERGTG